jgi:hypothetical protein
VATKEINLKIDLSRFKKQMEDQREREQLNPTENKVGVRTTVFSLGKSTLVSSAAQAKPPSLKSVEIMKDGLDNPFVRLNWRIDRESIDRAGVKGFKVFRKKISKKNFFREVKREDTAARPFTAIGFDKISRKIPSYGKFSQEKKAIVQIKPGLIPLSTLNSRLSIEENIVKSKLQLSLRDSKINLADSGLLKGSFVSFVNEKRFNQIGYVGCDKFLAQEKNKFVSITERDFIDVHLDDKSVRYGETYEYYIASVSTGVTENLQSNSVRVFVEDVSFVAPPKQILIKQVSASMLKLSVLMNAQDNVALALIYRRSDAEIAFQKVAVFESPTEMVTFFDQGVNYGQKYFYRVFLQNIHGTLSEPLEISVYSTDQSATPRSRSNVFGLPILTAQNDQNSDYIKINIAANDPRVAYYQLDKRNLTTKQKTFSVPSRNTGYGGLGWRTDKFFVNHERVAKDLVSKNVKDSLKTQTIQEQIEFIDDTVQNGHIYQYRLIGNDLYGNKTSYAFATIKAKNKISIRSPVNLRAEILRDFPLRIKLKWDDDNLSSRFTTEESFNVSTPQRPDAPKVLYKIQRRKLGQVNYDSFPLTANSFLVDEVSTQDAVDFSVKQVGDSFVKTSNISVDLLSRVAVSEKSERPFGMPLFLKENDVYFYRVAAVNQQGEYSNYSPEFKVFSVPSLSDPVNFKALVSNSVVRPIVARLTWETDITKSRPDRWIIERKVDVSGDAFALIGTAYLSEMFVDRRIDFGTSYIYRIKSVDSLGRESEFYEARLTV